MIEPQFLIIGGVAVIVGAGALIARAIERKRRAAFEEFSLIRGFTFEAERPNGEQHLHNLLEPFAQGRWHRWGYTMTGTRNGARFTALEFSWMTGGGKNSSKHYLSGMLWEQDGTAFPRFTLSPEGMIARIGQVFGMQDIDFVDSPDFSRTYLLRGPAEADIRKLFTPEIRRFFEATPGQSVAGGDRFLLWWRAGRLPAADRLDEWLEQGDQVRRRFFPR